LVKGHRPTPWGVHDRRRRFLINRLQTRYVVVQLCWTAAIVSLFACLVLGPTVYELFDGSADQQRRAAELFLDLHTRLFPALIALASALAALIVLQSHRIIGPLVRFKAVFEAVTRGELWVHSKIRAADYPQDEGRALNAMLASLRQRIGEAQAAAVRLEAALTHPEPGATDDARAALSQLRRSLTAYEADQPSAETPAAHEPPMRPLPPADVGFTLIETLLVASLISVLAAVAVPGYLAALEKARVTRAIGDIRSVQSEIQSHGIVNGCYPATLADVGFATLLDPWGSPYEYGVLEGAPGGGKGKGKGGDGGGACLACSGACLGRGAARKDRNLVPINSDFDFYSMGKDRQSVGPLTAQTSQDDVVRASDGGFIGLGRDY
jgi:general secretion pathway protein G